MQALIIVYVGGSLLLIALSIPMWAGKVRPNWWYGFRIKETLENPRLWDAVNRHAGKRLFITGAGTLAAAVGLVLVPDINVDGYALGCLAVFLILFLVGMAQSFRFLRTQREK